MDLSLHIHQILNALNVMAIVASLLLCAEFIYIVRVRKPPYPWSSYGVAFFLFAMACERLVLVTQPPQHEAPWQVVSHLVTNILLLVCTALIPLVRNQTYKRPKFHQLQEINEQLRYSQQLFKGYLESAPVVAYIKDEDGHIVQLNPEYSKLFHKRPAAVVGKTNLWGDPDASRRRDEQILAGTAEKQVTEILSVDDQTCAIYDIRFPLSGPNNEKMLGGIVFDVTDRLRWKNKTEVFASIVELTPDAIYCFDDTGKVSTWNSAAERMFGYSRDEMIGQSITKIVPDDKRRELREIIALLRDFPGASSNYETTRMSRDGKRIPVDLAAARVPGLHTERPTIACVAHDTTQITEMTEHIDALHNELKLKVSELSDTNTDLQKARDQAIESSSAKSAFVANISHELRTPLSGIVGMSELLGQRTHDDDTRRVLTMMEESAQGLLGLVNEVLNLARLEAGKGKVDSSQAEKAWQAQLESDATKAEIDLSTVKVLSVDDSPTVSRVTMLQLASLGVQAAYAMTGQEALEKVGAESFDLILMDVMLPDMTGFEAARRIRDMEKSTGKPPSVIIAFTGCSSESEKEAAAAAGMDDFLTKPASIDTMKQRLIKSATGFPPPAERHGS